MKIALVYAFKGSSWFSCTKITKNLIEAYRIAYKEEEISHHDYDLENKKFNLIELGDELFTLNPDKIVFLDHKPHPLQLIAYLAKKKYKSTNMPEYIFHIFGCFTLNFQNWKLLEPLLIDANVKFFCASDGQVKLVKQFFESENTYIQKVPFPVDSSEFWYDEKKNLVKERLQESYSVLHSFESALKYFFSGAFSQSSDDLKVGNDIKEKLQLGSDSKIIFYSGRLSLQKKIIELVDIFARAHKNRELSQNTYLLLAGKFDSFAFQFGNVYHLEGEYFREFDRAISKYPKSILEKIIFLGNVKNTDLQKYYSIADLFVSFSTYHDEDYGMSVAEAGSCGCPLLLTDWAGFSSFKKNGSCQLIRTYLTKYEPVFDKEEAYNKLVYMMNSRQDDQRKETALIFKEEHSIEAVSHSLKKYISSENTKFKGFNRLLSELAYCESTYTHTFYDEMDKELNDKYFKVYEAYVRQD